MPISLLLVYCDHSIDTEEFLHENAITWTVWSIMWEC